MQSHGMQRYEIQKSLEEKYGTFLMSKEVAEVFRADEHSVRSIMQGFKYFPRGHMKLWSAKDVATVAAEGSVMV